MKNRNSYSPRYDKKPSSANIAEMAKSQFSIKKEVFDFLEMLMKALVIVTLVFTFLLRIVGVQGTSMVSTLQDQDRLILSSMFYQPQKGDIVVVSLPDLFTEPIIKRVIATEGDVINITDEGEVMLNGERLDEPYTHDPTNKKSLDYPMTVPQDCVFIMGDNRNNSTDSRNFGCVNQKNIMGHAVFRIFPVNNIGPLD